MNGRLLLEREMRAVPQNQYVWIEKRTDESSRLGYVKSVSAGNPGDDLFIYETLDGVGAMSYDDYGVQWRCWSTYPNAWAIDHTGWCKL